MVRKSSGQTVRQCGCQLVGCSAFHQLPKTVVKSWRPSHNLSCLLVGEHTLQFTISFTFEQFSWNFDLPMLENKSWSRMGLCHAQKCQRTRNTEWVSTLFHLQACSHQVYVCACAHVSFVVRNGHALHGACASLTSQVQPTRRPHHQSAISMHPAPLDPPWDLSRLST